jgi:multiple sugar transport system permease protein
VSLTRVHAARGATKWLRPRRSLVSLERDRILSPSLMLLLPLVMLETAALFLPLIFITVKSFYNWQPGGASPFVGFGNYATLFGQAQFWQVVRNELFYLLGIPLWVAAPLVVAYMLREDVWFAGVFRTIYFIPAVMSPAIVGLVFRSLLAENGPVNDSLSKIGLGILAKPWLTDATLVKPVIIMLVLWGGFGTGVLIFSAALNAVPQEIFEASRLDGAGFWTELWRIALPQIRPTVLLWTMFQVLSIFLFMFSWIFVLTNGGPGLASTTMDFLVYQTFITFGFFGEAAAQSVLLLVMIILAVLALVVIPIVVRRIATRSGPSALREGR